MGFMRQSDLPNYDNWRLREPPDPRLEPVEPVDFDDDVEQSIVEDEINERRARNLLRHSI